MLAQHGASRRAAYIAGCIASVSQARCSVDTVRRAFLRGYTLMFSAPSLESDRLDQVRHLQILKEVEFLSAVWQKKLQDKMSTAARARTQAFN